MGHKFEFGTFELETSGNLCRLISIPKQMKCEDGNILCAILNVCSGRMNIYKDGKKLKLDINYFKLYVDSENSCPKKSSRYMDDFALIYPNFDKEYINRIDRKLIIESNKNIYVYNSVLNQLCLYFIKFENRSYAESFMHLYRILEFTSFTFPLMFSSYSSNFKGTYDSLKNYFTKDGGELAFFRTFLKILFQNDPVFSNTFEIAMPSSDNDALCKAFNKSISKGKKENNYSYEEGSDTLSISFSNMMDIFIEMRNRYFHMKVGEGQNNFDEFDYSMDDLFRSLNPVFLNWIALIFLKIFQEGFLNRFYKEVSN